MITLLTGENSFELKRALDVIVSGFDGEAEKFDGEELELNQLPDLLVGGTLFASTRLVIIKNLSNKKSLWEVFSDWIPRVSEDVHVVLVDPKPDKRTKTFKDLKKSADVKEFMPWGDHDVYAAEKWVADEAKRQGLALDKKCVQRLVSRVGLDQWQLFHALEKLSVLDTITPETIDETIESNPVENVFNLLDAALNGDIRKVQSMIHTLQRSQDPYMTFGLLAGQVFQLAALAVSGKAASEVAGDIGAHPYALGKLVPHAKKLGRSGAKKIAGIFADTDIQLKSTGAEPWLLIEQALVKTKTASS